MEALGEAGSSSHGRHGHLSIRGGGVSRVHPGRCSPSLKAGEELHVAPSVWEPPLALEGCGHSHGWPGVCISLGAEAGTEWILSEVFSLKIILSDFCSIAFCRKPTTIPRTLYTPRVVTGRGAQHTPKSALPWVPRAGHTIPLPWPCLLLPGPPEWWKGKCGLQLRGPTWAPRPWGSPWEVWWTIVPTAVGQPCLGECHASLLSVVMGHPSYLRAIGKSAGIICSRLRRGNIIAALTLPTQICFNTNGKGNREKQKKISGELLGCFRSHLWLRVCTACMWTRVSIPASYQAPGRF